MTSGPDDDITADVERLRFAASVLMLSAWSAEEAATWMEILLLVRGRHPACDSISLHAEPLEICVWEQGRLVTVLTRHDPLTMEIAASYDLIDDPAVLGPEGHHRSTVEIIDAFDRACATVRRSSPTD